MEVWEGNDFANSCSVTQLRIIYWPDLLTYKQVLFTQWPLKVCSWPFTQNCSTSNCQARCTCQGPCPLVSKDPDLNGHRRVWTDSTPTPLGRLLQEHQRRPFWGISMWDRLEECLEVGPRKEERSGPWEWHSKALALGGFIQTVPTWGRDCGRPKV